MGSVLSFLSFRKSKNKTNKRVQALGSLLSLVKKADDFMTQFQGFLTGFNKEEQKELTHNKKLNEYLSHWQEHLNAILRAKDILIRLDAIDKETKQELNKIYPKDLTINPIYINSYDKLFSKVSKINDNLTVFYENLYNIINSENKKDMTKAS